MTLADDVRAWLPRQRWFAGKGRPLASVELRPLATLAESPHHLDLVVARATYDDGGSEHYQLPLSRSTEPLAHVEHALIGIEDGAHVYDAVCDKEASRAWLELIAGERDLGPVRFRREALESPIDVTLVGRPLGAEQSNSSLVFGDELILKLYRKLAPGENPDLEVHLALARAGSKHIASPWGWIDGTWPGPDEAPLSGSLGMLQTYLRTASEGWAMALASVRDLYAEGDLHADEVGGDFAGESERLGMATAEVHADLAATLPTGTASPDEVRALAAQMRRRLDEACEVVPELRERADGVRAAFDALAGVEAPLRLQRIHGDYHLGQVLRTETGWTLLDFEGEPARPLAERRALASPLKDVAGMMRSFDYAARHLLADHAGEPHLEYRAAEWAQRNRGAFCDGYAEIAGVDPRDSGEVLRAFELDKAVYEVVYEARHRPAWLRIPMASIDSLAGGTNR